MSERITEVRPRLGAITPHGYVGGLQDWGRKTRSEMIALYRKHYQRQLEEAQAALDIPDDRLVVETFLGPLARRNVEEVR